MESTSSRLKSSRCWSGLGKGRGWMVTEKCQRRKKAPLKAAAQKSRDGDFGPVQRISSAMTGRANQRVRPSRPLRLFSAVRLGPRRSLGPIGASD